MFSLDPSPLVDTNKLLFCVQPMEKMLGYEHIFTKFLLSLVQGKHQKITGVGICSVESNDH